MFGTLELNDMLKKDIDRISKKIIKDIKNIKLLYNGQYISVQQQNQNKTIDRT